MKKRFIALFMIFTMLIVFATPMTSEAAWPWWGRNKHIVKADVVGALTGSGGGWVGALIGAAVGSLNAGMAGGQGGGDWEPPVDAVASVGLHHNLALKYVIGDQMLSDLDQKAIEEGLLNYAKQVTKDENDMKTVRMILSGEALPQLKTSDEFKGEIDMAMKMLDEEGNPKDLVGKAVASLREKAAELALDQIDAEIEKRMATGRVMDDIAYMIAADVMEHSFDFWGGNKEENMIDEFLPVDVESLSLRKFWKIVKADIKGANDGFNSTGTVGGAVGGAVGASIDAAKSFNAGQGGWSDAGEETLGSLHNRAVMTAYGAEDMTKGLTFFLGENGIDLNEAEIEAIAGCVPWLDCDKDPIYEWIKSQQEAKQMNVSDGFSGNIEEAMAVVFMEDDFDADKAKMALDSLLEKAAKSSDTQANILKASEYEAMMKKLKEEKKPEDIIYASIFVDMYLHSTGYWIGDEGPVRSTNYIIDIRKLLEPMDQWPTEISLNIGSDKATVNGEVKMMDVMPIIRDQRTLVPFRFIGEALNAEIGWIPEKQEVTYELGDMKLSLFIGQTRIIVNGVEKEIDTKPIIISSRTLVPIRVISETLGFEVEWIGEKQEVKIFSK